MEEAIERKRAEYSELLKECFFYCPFEGVNGSRTTCQPIKAGCRGFMGQPVEGHTVGHQHSRSSVEMVVDQERRGVTCRAALPRYKLLGHDQLQRVV